MDYVGEEQFEQKYQEDYGQKFADMNVEGMPWFQEEISEDEVERRNSIPELNHRETRNLIFSSILASLMVAGIFVLAFLLFILFCIKVWF